MERMAAGEHKIKDERPVYNSWQIRLVRLVLLSLTGI